MGYDTYTHSQRKHRMKHTPHTLHVYPIQHVRTTHTPYAPTTAHYTTTMLAPMPISTHYENTSTNSTSAHYQHITGHHHRNTGTNTTPAPPPAYHHDNTNTNTTISTLPSQHHHHITTAAPTLQSAHYHHNTRTNTTTITIPAPTSSTHHQHQHHRQHTTSTTPTTASSIILLLSCVLEARNLWQRKLDAESGCRLCQCPPKAGLMFSPKYSVMHCSFNISDENIIRISFILFIESFCSCLGYSSLYKVVRVSMIPRGHVCFAGGNNLSPSLAVCCCLCIIQRSCDDTDLNQIPYLLVTLFFQKILFELLLNNGNYRFSVNFRYLCNIPIIKWWYSVYHIQI